MSFNDDTPLTPNGQTDQGPVRLVAFRDYLDAIDPELDALEAPLASLFAHELAEVLTPIVYLVPLQLFTYWLALRTGQTPDTFRLNNPVHKAAREKFMGF